MIFKGFTIQQAASKDSLYNQSPFSEFQLQTVRNTSNVCVQREYHRLTHRILQAASRNKDHVWSLLIDNQTLLRLRWHSRYSRKNQLFINLAEARKWTREVSNERTETSKLYTHKNDKKCFQTMYEARGREFHWRTRNRTGDVCFRDGNCMETVLGRWGDV